MDRHRPTDLDQPDPARGPSTVPDLSWPPRLSPGDRVALVAPSGPIDADRLRSGRAVLESWGLDVTVGRRAHHVDPTLPHLAGTDADRAADFAEAWCADGVAAVWSARGGYGAQRVVDHLDWVALERSGPRLFIGSSDATALHDAIRSRLGLVTLFGPMPATTTFTSSPETAAHLHQALFGHGPMTHPGRVVADGTAAGTLIGGNLTLLATSIGCHRPGSGDPPGSAPAPCPRPAIALLEDVNEAPYAVDRALTQLLRSGWFEPVAGIVAGSFVGCGDPAVIDAVLVERLRPLGVPILAIDDIGHGPIQRAVWLGSSARLSARSDGTGQLTIDQPPAG